MMRALLFALFLLSACTLPPGTRGEPFVAFNEGRGGGRLTTTGTSSNTSEIASWDVDDSWTYGFGMSMPMSEDQTEGSIRTLTSTLASFARDALVAAEGIASTLHTLSGQLVIQREENAVRHAEIMAALAPDEEAISDAGKVGIGAGGTLGTLGVAYLIIKRLTRKDDDE
jgi:hypothetical protein